MAFELDTSVLMPQGPSPVSRGLSRVGGVMDAIIARRTAKAQAQQEMAAKAAELSFRQAQEERLRQQQQQEAERFKSEQEAKARAEKATAVKTAAEMERQGSGGAVPAYLGALGAKLAPKQVPEVDRMLAQPDPQLLAAGDNGDVGMLGLAQSMAERARSNQATAANEDAVRGKQILSWGDGSESEYAPADDGSDLERRLMGLNPNDPKVVRAIAEARAAKLQGKDTLNYIENERKRQAAIEAARIRAAAKGRGGGAGKPMTGAQKDVSERGWVTGFRGDTGDWEKTANVDKLTDAYGTFNDLAANVAASKSGDVISQRAALFRSARLIQGAGVLTDSDIKNTVGASAGLLASALTKLQKADDGAISAAEAAALDKFVASANQAVRAKAVRAVKNFDTRYHKGNAYSEHTPEQVQAYRASLLDRFGLTDADLSPEKNGGVDISASRARALELLKSARGGGSP